MARPKEGYFLADGTKVPGTTTITGRYWTSYPAARPKATRSGGPDSAASRRRQ
jgi:hypothetical protein